MVRMKKEMEELAAMHSHTATGSAVTSSSASLTIRPQVSGELIVIAMLLYELWEPLVVFISMMSIFRLNIRELHLVLVQIMVSRDTQVVLVMLIYQHSPALYQNLC